MEDCIDVLVEAIAECGFNRFPTHTFVRAQTPASSSHPIKASPETEDRVEQLSRAVDRVEAQIQASQRELTALKQQLEQMKGQIAGARPGASASISGANDSEQRSLEESQIATLDQIKVESISKYPLRLSGSILLNGFTNSGRVDQASAPTSVLGIRSEESSKTSLESSSGGQRRVDSLAGIELCEFRRALWRGFISGCGSDAGKRAFGRGHQRTREWNIVKRLPLGNI